MLLAHTLRAALTPKPAAKRPTRRLSVERLETRDNPAGGVLDPTFGVGGVATMPTDSTNSGTRTAVQADGKIVVVHSGIRQNTVSGAIQQPVVSRLNPNGTPDPTFGSNGSVALPVAKDAVGRTVAVQPDGKILVGANAYAKGGGGRTGPSDEQYAVARLNPNGTLDATFGNSSGWWLHNPTSQNETLRELAVVATGPAFSIYVGADSPGGFTAVKLTAAGRPDTTYGAGGFAVRRVTTGIGNSVTDMAVTPAGRVVFAGDLVPPGGSLFTGVLVAFTPAGQPDAGFDGDGVAYPTVAGSRFVNIYGLAAQGESVIVAGRAAWAVGQYASGMVMRITPAGAIDSTFATAGVFLGPGNSTTEGTEFKDVKVAGDGSVVVVGVARKKDASGVVTGGLVLGRLSADGQPDATFGPAPDGSGLVFRYEPYPGLTSSMTLTLDADGNMLISGFVGSYPVRGTVARFTAR